MRGSLYWRLANERTSCASSWFKVTEALSCMTRFKDLLRDIFNTWPVDLLGRRFHIEIIFHEMYNRSAAEVKYNSFVIVYLWRCLWYSKSFCRSESLAIIELWFVERVLQGFIEYLGVIFLMGSIIVSQTIKGMYAHKTAWAFWSIGPICTVL